jgi:hypothetical protein
MSNLVTVVPNEFRLVALAMLMADLTPWRYEESLPPPEMRN